MSSVTRGPGRVVVYLVVAVAGVALVLGLWSSMSDRSPGGSGSSASSAATPPTGERVEDGASVADGTVVEGADGTVYESPTVRRGSSDVLVVQVTITAPPGDGTVEVDAPEPLLVTGSGVVAPDPDPEGETSRTTRGGGLTSFLRSFSDTGIAVGEQVTVRLGLPDGTTYDVEGVEVTAFAGT